MHPNNIQSELDESKDRIKQLEGLKQIKNEKYGELLIKYFAKFNPFKISNSTEYHCYVSFNHPLNFQATESCFQQFAYETGMIPTAWWYEKGITTIAFDKIFYPKNSALVE